MLLDQGADVADCRQMGGTGISYKQKKIKKKPDKKQNYHNKCFGPQSR